MEIIQISEKLLFAVKTQKDHKEFVDRYANCSYNHLISSIDNDDKKKTFWINTYNAYYQIFRQDIKVDKTQIYKLDLISFKDFKLSLDDIEHGILRKYRYKYSLGFLPNIFTSKRIKQLALDSLDFRIHFALNCGAESCPPIAFYKLSSINKQLDLATGSFLDGDVVVHAEDRIVKVSQLFKWYWFDFGGKSGIHKIIYQYLDKTTDGFKIHFNLYSWEDDLNNYIDL